MTAALDAVQIFAVLTDAGYDEDDLDEGVEEKLSDKTYVAFVRIAIDGRFSEEELEKLYTEGFRFSDEKIWNAIQNGNKNADAIIGALKGRIGKKEKSAEEKLKEEEEREAKERARKHSEDEKRLARQRRDERIKAEEEREKEEERRRRRPRRRQRERSEERLREVKASYPKMQEQLKEALVLPIEQSVQTVVKILPGETFKGFTERVRSIEISRYYRVYGRVPASPYQAQYSYLSSIRRRAATTGGGFL